MKFISSFIIIFITITQCVSISIMIPTGIDNVKTSNHIELRGKTIRMKRSYLGQTQTQYLNFGNTENEGKAEAEATKQGSRAFVAGSNGMGQAQSQFSGVDCGSCAECRCGAAETPEPLTSVSYGRIAKPSIVNQAPVGGETGAIPFSQLKPGEDSQIKKHPNISSNGKLPSSQFLDTSQPQLPYYKRIQPNISEPSTHTPGYNDYGLPGRHLPGSLDQQSQIRPSTQMRDVQKPLRGGIPDFDQQHYVQAPRRDYPDTTQLRPVIPGVDKLQPTSPVTAGFDQSHYQRPSDVRPDTFQPQQTKPSPQKPGSADFSQVTGVKTPYYEQPPITDAQGRLIPDTSAISSQQPVSSAYPDYRTQPQLVYPNGQEPTYPTTGDFKQPDYKQPHTPSGLQKIPSHTPPYIGPTYISTGDQSLPSKGKEIVCKSQDSQPSTIPLQSPGCGGVTIVVGTGGPHQAIINENYIYGDGTYAQPSKQTIQTHPRGTIPTMYRPIQDTRPIDLSDTRTPSKPGYTENNILHPALPSIQQTAGSPYQAAQAHPASPGIQQTVGSPSGYQTAGSPYQPTQPHPASPSGYQIAGSPYQPSQVHSASPSGYQTPGSPYQPTQVHSASPSGYQTPGSPYQPTQVHSASPSGYQTPGSPYQPTQVHPASPSIQQTAGSPYQPTQVHPASLSIQPTAGSPYQPTQVHPVSPGIQKTAGSPYQPTQVHPASPGIQQTVGSPYQAAQAHPASPGIQQTVGSPYQPTQVHPASPSIQQTAGLPYPSYQQDSLRNGVPTDVRFNVPGQNVIWPKQGEISYEQRYPNIGIEGRIPLYDQQGRNLGFNYPGYQTLPQPDNLVTVPIASPIHSNGISQYPSLGPQTSSLDYGGLPSTCNGQCRGSSDISFKPSSEYIPATISGVGDLVNDSFSQAESSVKNGHAKASAQGKKGEGSAQTQVSGTYTGSGSFSASAMTSDVDRSANSQVSGNSEGATSQAQGIGGTGKSQSQVQVNAKTGGTTAESQSSGDTHQSQSEVQANEKGGLADAQSSGPRQTSSQAQIGFKPSRNVEESGKSIFNGGGEASAQSGSLSGQSQSQIHGKFKLGISYHGAAQAASGTKEQVATYREQNKVLFQEINQFENSQPSATDNTDATYDSKNYNTPYSETPHSESDLRLRTSSNNENKEIEKANSDFEYEEEDEIDYDGDEDEFYYSQVPAKMDSDTNNSDSSLQNNGTKSHSPFLKPINSGVENSPYSSKLTTEKTSDDLSKNINIKKTYQTRYLPSKNLQTQNNSSNGNMKSPDSYVTITKSITGSLDNSKNPSSVKQNFSSTFYTKSSTCGYFTFSCNIVYGTNGRSKICRPKAPANGKC